MYSHSVTAQRLVCSNTHSTSSFSQWALQEANLQNRQEPTFLVGMTSVTVKSAPAAMLRNMYTSQIALLHLPRQSLPAVLLTWIGPLSGLSRAHLWSHAAELFQSAASEHLEAWLLCAAGADHRQAGRSPIGC